MAAAASPALARGRPALWWEKYAYGGLSCQIAACVTNPIDVIKVRLQLQGELQRTTSSSSSS
ncbi:MC/SLC25 family protein, partial [Vibrio parahaemolyticus]